MKYSKAMLPKVEKLAMQGLTIKQICHCLDISHETFIQWRRGKSEFSEAYEKGKAKGVGVVTNKLFELCEQGNLGAICFYLKARDNWSDKQQIEIKQETTINDNTKDIEYLKSLPIEQLEKIAKGEVEIPTSGNC